MSASSTSRSTWTRSCITRSRPTARFSRKASTRRARWRRSSPPARPIRPTASTRSRSSSTTRCSASSASAISSGPPPIRAAAGSCWAAPPDARRWPAKGCSIRTAQPRAVVPGAELRVLRSRVCLRARGHHRRRHQADVRRAGEHLLLPDGDERAVRDAADARRAPTSRAAS